MMRLCGTTDALCDCVGSDDNCKFDRWLTELQEDVIQGEYGYEEGEFDVYWDLWYPSYQKGFTPHDAFVSALKAFRDNQISANDGEKPE